MPSRSASILVEAVRNVIATVVAAAICYAAWSLSSLDKRVSRIEDRLGIATAAVR